MTGFGIGDAPLGGGRVVAEIRSVNHRFLEVRARVPRELGELSLFAEQVARERLRRGRVELGVRSEGPVLAEVGLDRARARAAFQALRDLRDELAAGEPLPLSVLAAVPDLFAPPAGPESDAAREAVRLAIHRAIEAMDRMSRHEGTALAADLGARIDALTALVCAIAERLDGTAEAVRLRLRQRLDRLLASLDEPSRADRLDPVRLESEIALLAERGDATEELTRLESHLGHMRTLLADDAAGADDASPVGRRLDFLLQEMVRETNTLGAKAQDAEVSHHVVAMKVELERLREQVQNVE
jgi:uncharacterized protein (TIGR00255 family)